MTLRYSLSVGLTTGMAATKLPPASREQQLTVFHWESNYVHVIRGQNANGDPAANS